MRAVVATPPPFFSVLSFRPPSARSSDLRANADYKGKRRVGSRFLFSAQPGDLRLRLPKDLDLRARVLNPPPCVTFTPDVPLASNSACWPPPYGPVATHHCSSLSGLFHELLTIDADSFVCDCFQSSIMDSAARSISSCKPLRNQR